MKLFQLLLQLWSVALLLVGGLSLWNYLGYVVGSEYGELINQSRFMSVLMIWFGLFSLWFVQMIKQASQTLSEELSK